MHIKTYQMHQTTSSSLGVDGGKGLINGEKGMIKVISMFFFNFFKE